MRRALIAAIEADQAKVALAGEGLEELEALVLLCLQRGLLDEERAERVSEALGRVTLGLSVVRKWMGEVRYGERGRSLC